MSFANILSSAKSGDEKKAKASLAALPEKLGSVKKIKTACAFKTDMPLPIGSYRSVIGHTIQPDKEPPDGTQPATRADVVPLRRNPGAYSETTSPIQQTEVPTDTSSPISSSETLPNAASTVKVTIVKEQNPASVKQTTTAKDDSSPQSTTPLKGSTVSRGVTPLEVATCGNQDAKLVKKVAAAITEKLPNSTSEQRMSLARLKADAIATIKERYAAVSADYDKFVAIVSTTKGKKLKEAVEDALREAMKTLAAQRGALEKDLKKLKSFGEGFDLAQIKRIDAQALVAFSYWSDATVNRSRFDAVPARAVAQLIAPLDNTASKVALKDKPLVCVEKIEKPSPSEKEETQKVVRQATVATPEQVFPPPPTLSDKPALKPARKSSAMVPSERAGAKSEIARTPQYIPVSREHAKKKTTILDMDEAADAQAVGKVAEAKRTVKTGNGGFVKTKSRGKLSAYDGELKIRKNAPTILGEKRKRGDVMEGPNKHSAIEGRDRKPLRVRRTPPLPESMEFVTEPAPSSTILALNV